MCRLGSSANAPVHTTAASNTTQTLRQMCPIGFIALAELATTKESLEQINADRAPKVFFASLRIVLNSHELVRR
jgi:hypothetical protein